MHADYADTVKLAFICQQK